MITKTPPVLIPRRVLFGDPDRINPALSPDGTLLAYAAPHQGVMNLWTEPVDRSRPARPVTHDRGRGITEFTLCAGGRLVYTQDTGGDENWRLYLLDLDSGHAQPVTPRPSTGHNTGGQASGQAGVQARVLAYHPGRHPDQMLIAGNADDPALHDVYRLELCTGELTRIESNPGHHGRPPFVGWLADTDLNVRGGAVPAPDGGLVLHVSDHAAGPWRPLLHLPADDLTPDTTFDFTGDGTALITLTSLHATTTRLARIDLADGHVTTLHADPGHDLSEVWTDPATGDPVVAVSAPHRNRYHLLDPTFSTDLERLTDIDDGDSDVSVIGTAGDGRLLLATTTAPHSPPRYHLYNRDTQHTRLLFPQHDELAEYRLAPAEPFRLTARDGLDLHGYLTRPPGVAGGPLPAVVVVHGGPWARDHWRYHPQAQWLANRGYAVIQVNFRGSTGYGKAHLTAGDRQWGRAMQDDLLDTVGHLADAGVIDPDRVAIYGGSYGGYAALCGAAFGGQVFCCAVSACGPADLATLIGSIPPYHQPMINLYHTRVGHPDHDADHLREVSPLAHATGIGIPLLIAQGANDPRVPIAQADALVAALNQHDIPHRYLVFDDEGHGLDQPGNREIFYAQVETFLATHLGGQQETGR